MDFYKYNPLEPGSGEIRLLKLLPAPAEAEIVIEISHEPLIDGQDAPKYEALSYVWGTPDRVAQVLVSSHPQNQGSTDHGISRKLAVTQNLSDALHRLRDTTEPRKLWIDGICINQDDLIERSAEVGRMGSIYSLAWQVIFWLGPEADDSSLAMETLSSIGGKLERVDNVARNSTFYFSQDIEYFDNGASENWEEKVAILTSIKHLYRRQWFKRLWICQEMKVATQAVVICGNSDLRWEIFKNALAWIYYRAIHSIAIGEIVSPNELENIVKLTVTLVKSFPNLLRLTSRLACLDPRDRIYALLGILGKEERLGIQPDYSKSVESVLKDFTVRYIENKLQLNIFRLCRFPATPLSRNLPSWVPNLTSKRAFSFDYFHSSGTSRHQALFNPKDDTLCIRGLHALNISKITRLPVPFGVHSTRITTRMVCEAWAPDDVLTAPYIGGGSLEDAFVTVLVAGCIEEDAPLETRAYFPLSSSKKAFNSFLCWNEETQHPEFTEEEANFVSRLQDLDGYAFFVAENGFIGLCPVGAEPGDRVVIVLGCDAPLLLRPLPGAVQGRYILIGGCYVQGMMYGEGLLGPLPPGWRQSRDVLEGIWRHYFIFDGSAPKNDEMGTQEGKKREVSRSQHDPRLGPLPSGWRSCETDGEGKACRLSFCNDETRIVQWEDPRLSSVELRRRGVDIQDFVLV